MILKQLVPDEIECIAKIWAETEGQMWWIDTSNAARVLVAEKGLWVDECRF